MNNEHFFNENYYKFCCGELPYDDPAWLPFFENVADQIVKDWNPSLVLDVGCAMGHLVSALRDKGVDAYGIDISPYAINKVRKEHQAYCRVWSALDPLPQDFPQHFDLITTIEVVEHLHEEEGDCFIQNLCAFTDVIIFSSTPEDFTEATHFNVQQPEYWLKRFAKQSFYRDLLYDCSYISPQAFCVTKFKTSNEKIVANYEHSLRLTALHLKNLKKTINEVTASSDQQVKQIEELRTQLQALNQSKSALKAQFDEQFDCLISAKNASVQLSSQIEIVQENQRKTCEELKASRENLKCTEERLKCTAESLQHKEQQLKYTEESWKNTEEKLKYAEESIKYTTEQWKCTEESLKEIKEDLSCLTIQKRQLEEELCIAQTTISEKQGEIYALIEQVNERDSHLKAIYKSRCYRCVLIYYRFKDIVKKLFSSLVRFLLVYPYKTVLYLVKRGPKATIKKIRSKLFPLSDQQQFCCLTPPDKHVFPAVVPHTENVDIIICVHNALEDVKKCIESVFEYTLDPYQIIIVDDGSAAETCDYLEKLEKGCPNVYRIRNKHGNGYTIAANMGLRASTAEFCVLLNSDTIVTPGWIDKMICCAKTDAEIGIVGPLSNTASWQSVPKIFGDDGDWCRNNLPQYYDVAKFGNLIEKYSDRIFPTVPLLNGFCMMVTRSTLNKIGFFDEENFGKGFGEEDDYNLRALTHGIKLAIADDTYIYHAQSKSYSDEKRLQLCKDSGQKVRAKHGDALIDQSIQQMRNSYVLEGIRARTLAMIEREHLRVTSKKLWEGKRLLFILPIAEAGGGGNVIIQEALIMQEIGINVCLYNRSDLRSYFEAAYPGLPIPVLYGNGIDGFLEYCDQFDAVCSTLYASVKYCDFHRFSNPPKTVYYIQDYEPYFFREGSSEYQQAYASYTQWPDLIRVTKTSWNANEVFKHHHVTCSILGPSVNIDLFRPRKMLQSSAVVNICAMVRPSSSRRAPELTMEVLRRIKNKYKGRVQISVFGCEAVEGSPDYAFLDTISTDFEFQLLGKLTPLQMSRLLGEHDVFADFSSFQAMGLTAMEAMASACAVIVPENGGTGDFAANGINCLVVDTSNIEQCFFALCQLIDSDQLRDALSHRAVQDMCKYYPEKSVYQFLNAVFG